MLLIYFGAEMARSLGRRLVPQSFDIIGSEVHENQIYSFGDIIDTNETNLSQYFDLSNSLWRAGDDRGSTQRADPRFARFERIAGIEALSSDLQDIQVNSRDLWMYIYFRVRSAEGARRQAFWHVSVS
jgi:hypothetical protein